MGNINLSVLIASLMVASVPILLAALGEMVTEKAGVLNLGVQGMMITGAISGFAVAVHTGSPLLGFAAGAAGGATLSLLFALLILGLQANQVASGLALTLFGVGLSSLIGQSYSEIRAPQTKPLDFGPLGDIPFIGNVVFSHDWVVYLSLFMVAAIWWFVTRTRGGLVLRAVGESAEAAHALGYKVARIRLAAIAFGGAMAGMGGAYISLFRVPQWTDGIVGDAGWFALAIVVFASWRPVRVLIGAYLFGGITVLQLNLQAAGSKIPVEYLSMAPYLVTIVVLVAISAGKGRAAVAPAALGQNFHSVR